MQREQVEARRPDGYVLSSLDRRGGERRVSSLSATGDTEHGPSRRLDRGSSLRRSGWTVWHHEHVESSHRFVKGGIYEDCAYHPVLCTDVNDEAREIQGISLLDGSIPRSCSIDHCGPEPLGTDAALLIRLNFDSYKRLRVAGKSVDAAIIELPRRAV